MDDKQKIAIKTALADLISSLQAKNNLDFFSHDWKGHLESINDLMEAFPELTNDYVDEVNKLEEQE
jgi:hypothetical protein